MAAVETTDKQRLIRRHFMAAWLAMLAAFAVFCAILFGLYQLGESYFGSATTPFTAELSRVPETGTALYVLPHTARQESLFASDTQALTEGDSVRTDDNTNARLSLLDGGVQVTVYGNSRVLLRSLQRTRFNQNQAVVELVVTQGMIRVNTAPTGYRNARLVVHGCRVEAETEVRCPYYQDIAHTTVDVNQPNSLRVSVADDPAAARYSRTTVLSGTAEVEAQDLRTAADGKQQITLTANQMSTTGVGGGVGVSEEAWDELVRDGSFRQGLAFWKQAPIDQGTDGKRGPDPTANVVTATLQGKVATALNLSRCPELAPGAGCDDYAAVLVSQPANREVRAYNRITFAADIQLRVQDPPGGGDGGYEFPIILKLVYRSSSTPKDESSWVYGYYFLCPLRGCDSDPDLNNRSENISPNTWVHVEIPNLRDSPPLKNMYQIGSVELYAAGHKYDSLITNISLKAR